MKNNRFSIRILVLLLASPLLLASCSSGRYGKIGQGPPLYPEKELKWRPSQAHPVKTIKYALTYCQWLPTVGVKPRGIIIAVPGLDESCVEWAPMGRHLAARGYEVYASDLRGQGKDHATPHRGNYHDWRQWVLDVNDFAHQKVRGRRLPIAYVGQSLGALVAASAAAETTGSAVPRTVVLHSPALALAYPPWFARPAVATLQVLSLNLIRVTTPAALKVTQDSIVSNEADEKAWEISPDRVSLGFTPHYFSTCFDIGHHMHGVPARLPMPVLVQYGKNDSAMKHSKCTFQQFSAMLPSANNKTWKHPDDLANHDMLNDRHMRRELLRQMTTWLDQKM